MSGLTGAGNRFDSCAALTLNMNKDKENLIAILNAYAAGINESISGYHALVDVSGDIPQLCIR